MTFTIDANLYRGIISNHEEFHAAVDYVAKQMPSRMQAAGYLLTLPRKANGDYGHDYGTGPTDPMLRDVIPSDWVAP